MNEPESNETKSVDARDRADIERAREQAKQSLGSLAPPPDRIGSYEILGVIGQGGMGTVYRARQQHPAREVGLKLIRPSDSPTTRRDLRRRLKEEAELLGRLQHPGIARIYEAGTFGDGANEQPFFVMELIEGRPLTKYADENKLSIRARLDLFAKICDAVHHAHQKGVIHRDLKPGNILVTDDGQPKVLDFGVARTTESDLQVTTIESGMARLIGTVPYMSPEQVGGRVDELDTRSDVYALGVVLYELLTGRLPYDLSQRLIHEAVRVIREDEPTRLSSHNSALRGDVDTIVVKAMEKEKDRRYQSAVELGTDVRRYLADEPIAARPPSAAYQLRKFARRHKAFVGGVAAVFVTLVTGVIISTHFFFVSEKRADELQVRTEEAIEAKELAQRRAAELSRQVYRERIASAWKAYQVNHTPLMGEYLASCAPEYRGWEWDFLSGLFGQSKCTLALDAKSSSVMAVAGSSDGKLIATGDMDGELKLWDSTTGEILQTVHAFAQVGAIAFSPDGARIAASASRGFGTTIKLWELPTMKELTVRPGNARRLEFSKDGSKLIAIGTSIEILDVENLDVRSTVATGPTNAVVSSDGEWIAWHRGETIFRYDVMGEEMREVATTKERIPIAISAGGTLMAVAEIDVPNLASMTVNVVRAPSGDETAYVEVLHIAEAAPFAAFSSDGKYLIAANMFSGRIHTWDIPSERRIRTITAALSIRDPSVLEIPLRLTRRDRLIVGNVNGGVRVWDRGMYGEERSPRTIALAWGNRLSASVDGRRLAVVLKEPFMFGEREVHVFDARTLQQTLTLRPNKGWFSYIKDVAFSLDGRHLLTGGSHVGLWDANDGKKIQGFSGAASAVAFSTDGVWMVAGQANGAIRVMKAPDGALETIIARDGIEVRSIAFARDGHWCAVSGMSNGVRVFSTHNWTPIQTITAPWEGSTGIAASPNSRHLAIFQRDESRAEGDWPILIMDVETGNVDLSLAGHGVPASGVVFSPNGDRVISGASDGSIRIWDVETGDQMLRLDCDPVYDLALIPHGSHLVVLGSQGITIW